jgi:hypothetical protein
MRVCSECPGTVLEDDGGSCVWEVVSEGGHGHGHDQALGVEEPTVGSGHVGVGSGGRGGEEKASVSHAAGLRMGITLTI